MDHSAIWLFFSDTLFLFFLHQHYLCHIEDTESLMSLSKNQEKALHNCRDGGSQVDYLQSHPHRSNSNRIHPGEDYCSNKNLFHPFEAHLRPKAFFSSAVNLLAAEALSLSFSAFLAALLLAFSAFLSANSCS